MISARVDPTAAIARLGALADSLRSGVRALVGDGAARLYALVEAKLSGEVLHARSGALARSIRIETNEDADGIGARVFGDGSVPYARIQEFGGRIAVPEIAAVNAKALAFVYGGRMQFARHTAAHVVDIPERSYMRSSLAEFENGFVDDVRELATECLA